MKLLSLAAAWLRQYRGGFSGEDGGRTRPPARQHHPTTGAHPAAEITNGDNPAAAGCRPMSQRPGRTRHRQQRVETVLPTTRHRQQKGENRAPDHMHRQERVETVLLGHTPPSTKGENRAPDHTPPSTKGGNGARNHTPPSTKGENRAPDYTPPLTKGENGAPEHTPPSTKGENGLPTTRHRQQRAERRPGRCAGSVPTALRRRPTAKCRSICYWPCCRAVKNCGSASFSTRLTG